MSYGERLQELADFLKTRRARLSPEAVGLPAGNRRRTPGLRREEVAELAGISATWYTWLEQARKVTVSPATARKLSKALNLDSSERRYLFELLDYPQLIEYDNAETVDEHLQSFLQSLRHPAYFLNHRWDVLDWNAAAEAIFEFSRLNDKPPNLVQFTFTNRRILSMSTNWRSDAREMLARFRIDYGQYVEDDAELEQMVRRLQKQSEDFNKWWQEHDVINPIGWQRSLHFEGIGEITMHTELLERSSAPFPRLIAYLPVPASAARMELVLKKAQRSRG